MAARLWRETPGVEFLVINVAAVAVPWVGSSSFGVVAPLQVDPRWFSYTGDENDEDEAQLMAQAEAAGVPDPDVLMTAGDPVTRICAVADDHDVDVIVGSHDKTALRRLFDSSVAAGVVRDTYGPVLVVSGTPPSDR